ncbi:Glycine/D-amino acid oxidase [Zhouia amylolytica]|uniref:Glycine/D-amino acid oxidase n=1 Tax=Zhouia amylolytica TaxID=376730 RepID=A0A1I6S781_9FLAO|nr:FAD-dependent oxidoreductase [Zhouia amylolytica]MCQ0110985.1 FAD-binding oxidoreductase [Zhouia amylolytica]SFS72807.1 Glycine/D-amino acid oxidase [Zhouia amylolytica]
MNFSYWEIKQWISNTDYTIVGSGLVGLNCALKLRENHPKASILVLEKGVLPQGASTKNAGFACFGSLSELLDDLNLHTEDEMIELVQLRYKGLKLLKNNLGAKNIKYKNRGGYELFLKTKGEFFESCLENRERINELLKPYFKKNVFKVKKNEFGFNHIQDHLIFNQFEGQIDTGKMMDQLLKRCIKKNIHILNATSVSGFEDLRNGVHVTTDHFQFKTKNLLIANNGFAQNLLNIDVEPARAQVLITKPVKKLPFKGTFHLDKGFYYFRNINGRILLGGGRNLDIEGENTTDLAQTPLIQNKLEELLKTTILPNTPHEIEHRWSGIMGVGSVKKPIVQQLSENVYCGVRLGGMGVAIGSQIGADLANLTAGND